MNLGFCYHEAECLVVQRDMTINGWVHQTPYITTYPTRSYLIFSPIYCVLEPFLA